MNKKVKFLSVAASMALAASLGTPALADAPGPGVVPVHGGTEVYAGVTNNTDATSTNLKVTVPTLFSFVVAPAADGDGSEAISVDDGTLLLPNVKVDGSGKVSAVGQSQLNFTNYSTHVTAASAAGKQVAITGTVVTEAGTSWVYSPGTPDAAHEYRLTLGDNPFDTPMAEGGYACKTEVVLDAPNVSVGVNVAEDGTAVVGETTVVTMGVEVGGTIAGYSSNEASAKVGTIVWTITAKD